MGKLIMLASLGLSVVLFVGTLLLGSGGKAGQR